MSEPTYRGILIPDRIQRDREANGKYAVVFHAWREGVDAVLGIAVPLLDELADDEPCTLDHHGYCQMHGLPQPGPCPDGEARRLIEEARNEG